MTAASAVLEKGFETLAGQVDQAVNAALALDVDARDKAMMLKHAVEEFHQYALARIVQTLKADPRGRDLLFGMLDEPSIYALFAMHGLIRVDPQTKVHQALENVRPYMQSHNGDVELVEVRENAVYLRLHGICADCSSSSSTLTIVEKAIRATAPEIAEIIVVPNAPTVPEGFIPLDSISIQAR